jgi:O-antigen ligase
MLAITDQYSFSKMFLNYFNLLLIYTFALFKVYISPYKNGFSKYKSAITILVTFMSISFPFYSALNDKLMPFILI